MMSAISISNTKNRIASKKNCMENGTRDLFMGSNPHSNGFDISLWGVRCKERISVNIFKKIVNKIETENIYIIPRRVAFEG